MSEEKSDNAYWKANLRLILWSLVIWAAVSFGFGILLRPMLAGIPVGGTDLGFWFAQQGSILVFLTLIFFYAWRMNRLMPNMASTSSRRKRQWTSLPLTCCLWARALRFTSASRSGPGQGPHRNSTPPGAAYIPLPTEWQPRPTGCRRPHSSRWPVSSPFGGYGASSFLMGWTGGYVLLALLLAPYLRKFGKFTVPEFIGDRFYSPTARMVAVLCLIVASVTYVIGQMTGVGVAFSRFLEVSNTVGLLIGAAVVFMYAVLGGMKGITYTQVAQYCVLITAYTIPAIFISLQLTGNPIPALGLFSTHEASGEPLLGRLNEVVQELGFAAYTTQDGTPSSVINMTLFTFSLMIGTAGLPHVIIRFFTVPKVADARWSAGWALVFIALLYLTAPAVGAMARLNLIDTVYPNGTQSEPIDYEARPDWIKNWEVTGLLQFEDKNGDGKIQWYNDGSEAFATTAKERGWQGSELNVNRDILVLANPEIAGLPSWVIALVAAGGLAAALSTAAGLLLAIPGR